MIFVGDIATSECNQPLLVNMPEALQSKKWFGNLEGGIVKNDSHYIKQRVVFNDIEAIKEFKSKYNITFALANNHILDTGSIENTLPVLRSLNIMYVGAGENISFAEKPLLMEEQNGIQYVIHNFGWFPIQCTIASKNNGGINPYTKEHVIGQVKKSINQYKKAIIIVYFHWNYELELYPQPQDREIARCLIDMGCEAIIGSHAHRVQGIEFYKKKPIIYGLGNWLFPQNVYFNGKLKFPEFTHKELAFEIVKPGEYKCHWFNYNPNNQKVYYENSSRIYDSNITFANLNNHEYKKWFKKNRYQKKILPIFNYDDSRIIRLLKEYYVRNIRHKVILFLLFLKK